MKKVLLGTSALVLAGLMAAPAQAQLEARVGMDIRAMAALYNFDNADQEQGANATNTASMRTDWRLPITVSGTADNGLNYGATVRLRSQVHSAANTAGNQGVRFDQAFVFLSGAWGRVEVGDNFIGIFRDRVTAPVVGIGQVDGMATIDTGVAAPFAADSAAVRSQFLYQSPNFSGFRVTVSFSPEDDQGNAFTTTNTQGRFKNFYSVSARYSGNFEGISLLVGGGLNGAQRHNATGTQANEERWQIGAQIGWAGLTIGGNYWHDGYQDNDSANGRNEGFAAGVTYTMGAWSFGGSVASGTDRPAGNTQTDTLYSLGVNYNIAPGLSVGADFYATDLGSLRKNTNTTSDRVRGSAGVARVRVTF